MPEFEWLGMLRHGQSTANVAAEAAEADGAEMIEVEAPDARVDLTDLGRAQAQAVGEWLAKGPVEAKPQIVVSSTYRRAEATAELVARAIDVPIQLDERLRDRELGILDRLTRHGVATRFPDENARRAFVGRFYYRPPGGESWADVAGRLRAALRDLRAEHGGHRVLIVAHEALIFLTRYVVEQLDVARLEELSGRPLANAGLTSWRNVGGRLTLASFDDVAPAHDRVTRQPHV
jgi:2,3-bisphosphoglycerate-dependent phosphoglycerate mutase